MAITIYPQVWEPFIFNQLVYQNNILNQGLVQIVNDPAIRAGDVTWRNPFYKSLDALANDDETITTSLSITYQSLTDDSELYPILHKVGNFTVHDYNKVTQGVDPMRAFAPQIAGRMLKQMQGRIGKLLTGVFNTTDGVLGQGAGTQTVDKSALAPDIAPEFIDEAAETYHGEANELFTGIIMHSAKFRSLKAQIQSVLTTLADGSQVMQNYFGKYRILQNNTICAPTAGKYPTYIYGGSPIVVGYQQALSLESSRDAQTLTDRIQWQYHYSPGVKGVSMTANNSNSSDANLILGTNYTKTAEDTKNILIAQLITL
jgi:hypothetical protein